MMSSVSRAWDAPAASRPAAVSAVARMVRFMGLSRRVLMPPLTREGPRRLSPSRRTPVTSSYAAVGRVLWRGGYHGFLSRRASRMKLGMVGLGRMGANMAQRLMNGGHAIAAYDPAPGARTALAERGATACDSLAS